MPSASCACRADAIRVVPWRRSHRRGGRCQGDECSGASLGRRCRRSRFSAEQRLRVPGEPSTRPKTRNLHGFVKHEGLQALRPVHEHEAPRLSISRFIIVVIACLASGCAVAPYEETFQCPLSSNYGTCTDVSGAYADAVAAPAMASDSARRTRGNFGIRSHNGRRPGARSAPNSYAVTAGVPAPTVVQPVMLRTWVSEYQDADGTLFAARYVFHLAGNSILAPVSVNVPQVQTKQTAEVLPLPSDAR